MLDVADSSQTAAATTSAIPTTSQAPTPQRRNQRGNEPTVRSSSRTHRNKTVPAG